MSDDILPPIELQAPDIARWQEGGSGVDWVHVFDSGRPGPKVMVQALTHGNEICGAIALDWLLDAGFRPQWGTLTLVFANVEAYARFDPADPFPSRQVDEDYNRVWDDAELFGARDSAELRRARLLQPFVDATDLLLDIHSMSEPCRPLMVCGTVEKNVAFARRLGVPGDLLVDTGHPAGKRMIDRGAFADPTSPRRALLIECGQHWERAAADVAIDALVRFLGLTGATHPVWVKANTRLPLPPVQRLVRVTEPVVARSADFRFLVPTEGLSVIARAGTPIAQDGDHVWSTPYDDAVLVMPGTRNLKPGGTAVRLGRFEVDRGEPSMTTTAHETDFESEAVRRLRDDLALALRAAAHHGLAEGVCNHFSIELPDRSGRFLLNPRGLLWKEVQAGDIVMVDGHGRQLAGRHPVEPTAMFIHAAIHRLCAQACVLHTHMPHATALTLTADRCLDTALSQNAMRFHGRIAVDAHYNGLALDAREGERIVKAMGRADVAFLGNHGVVVCGERMAWAYDDLYYLERACMAQVLAQSTGRPLVPVAAEIAGRVCKQTLGEREQSELFFEALRRTIS